MSGIPDQTSTAHGEGHSVNLSITDSLGKYIVGFLAILTLVAIIGSILALFAVNRASSDAAYAKAKSEEARIAAENADHNAKLAQYYTIDMEVYLFKQGLLPPQDPWKSKRR